MPAEPMPAPTMPADDEALYATLVGPQWETRYRARFAALAAGGSRMGFNVEAALLPVWGLRRRIPSLGLAALLFPVLGALLVDRVSLTAGFAVPTLLYAAAYGVFGDWIYWRRLTRLVDRIARSADSQERHALLASGRVRSILAYAVTAPLLMLIAFLVILAADPQYRQGPPDGPYEAAMKADLRKLAAAQDAHFEGAGEYTETLARWNFEPSPHVQVRILYADATGFAADATFGARRQRCYVFGGEARGLPEGMVDREPFCEPSGTERP